MRLIAARVQELNSVISSVIDSSVTEIKAKLQKQITKIFTEKLASERPEKVQPDNFPFQNLSGGNVSLYAYTCTINPFVIDFHATLAQTHNLIFCKTLNNPN
jgi:hypothetical protein